MKPTVLTLGDGGSAYVPIAATQVRGDVLAARRRRRPTVRFGAVTFKVANIRAIDGQELPDLDEHQAA